METYHFCSTYIMFSDTGSHTVRWPEAGNKTLSSSNPPTTQSPPPWIHWSSSKTQWNFTYTYNNNNLEK